MKRIRITATNFIWGTKHYKPGTVDDFHPHVAEAIIEQRAGEEVKTMEAEEDQKEVKKTTRKKRQYKRRDLQAEE